MIIDKQADMTKEVFDDVANELERAQSLGFGPPRSAHEGFAVILEELDELKAHVWMKQKNRDIDKMRKEAIEVAAMAIKFAVQCRDGEWGRR